MSFSKEIPSSINDTNLSGWYAFSLEVVKPHMDCRIKLLNHIRQNIAPEKTKSIV